LKGLKTSIIKSLYFSSPQSTADVSKAIGKSIPNVTKVINNLIKEDLIIDKGLAASTGGRRAAQFILNDQLHPKLICIAIDQYYTQACVYNIHNKYIVEPKTIENKLSDPQQAYNRIINLTQEMIDAQEDNHYLIGITMPGFVNHRTGINDSYEEDNPLYNLKQNIEAHFQIPTFIENDSTAIAIAEQKFGLAKHTPHALVVNLNWGVGLGMIINSELFRGHSGYAGEFSHTPLSYKNDLCSCGKRGCLEVEGSLLSAMNHIKQELENGVQSSIKKDLSTDEIDFTHFLSAIHAGDQLGIEATKKIANVLGKGISTLIHILNPEKIIISGRGSSMGEILINYIQTSVFEFSIPRLSQNTQIQVSNIVNAQLLGTAVVVVAQAPWHHLLKASASNLHILSSN